MLSNLLISSELLYSIEHDDIVLFDNIINELISNNNLDLESYYMIIEIIISSSQCYNKVSIIKIIDLYSKYELIDYILIIAICYDAVDIVDYYYSNGINISKYMDVPYLLSPNIHKWYKSINKYCQEYDKYILH